MATNDKEVKHIRVSMDTHYKVKNLAAHNRLTFDEMIQAMLVMWDNSDGPVKEACVKGMTGGVK